MKRNLVLLAASAVAVLFVSEADAQRGRGRSAGISPSAQLLLRFDADKDNVITKDEMEAGLKADYAAADTDGNNCLIPVEVRAENAKRLERDAQQASPLVDWNLDGCVDMREFSNTAHSYFDLADRTKDGRVSSLELRGPSMPLAPRTAASTRTGSNVPDPTQNTNTPAVNGMTGYGANNYGQYGATAGPGSGSGLPGSYAGY